MTRQSYLSLRSNLYSSVSELGHAAEVTPHESLTVAYEAASLVLDAIDNLGVQLGYLDRNTLEEIN